MKRPGRQSKIVRYFTYTYLLFLSPLAVFLMKFSKLHACNDFSLVNVIKYIFTLDGMAQISIELQKTMIDNSVSHSWIH